MSNKEKLEKMKRVREETKKAMGSKPFKNLNTPQKDKLLEALCIMFGLIEDK